MEARGVGSFGAGVLGSCELRRVGAGDQTRVLVKSPTSSWLLKRLPRLAARAKEVSQGSSPVGDTFVSTSPK